MIPYERLNDFVLSAKQYINSTPKSKLWYAADKVLKQALKKLKKFEEAKDEKRRELCLKKDKGVFDLTDRGLFQFDSEGHKKLNDAINKLGEEDSGLMPHLIPVGDYDEKPLTFDMRNSFEGIIIPEIDYEKFDWDNIPKEEEKKEGK